MYDCKHLTHPFLHDPGVAQDQRALTALLPDNIPIDGRQTADVLNYFSELAQQINFYNPDLSISDWTPFFNSSLPFLLSRIAAWPLTVQQDKLNGYAKMLERNATASSLQLLIFYSYYTMVLPLQRWALLIEGTGLDLETDLNKSIKANLQQPLLSYISLVNTANHCWGTRKIDFSGFLGVPAWGLEQADLYAYQGSFLCNAGGTRTQILALWEQLNALLPFFTGVIGQAASGAADDVNDQLQTLLTLDGNQDLSPHLALLFSFLGLFQQLKGDLNTFSKKHLNYFYTCVLQLKPAPAVPDNAFLVFNIQKQYTQYLLNQGLLVKDGKDNNKTDILFGLDDYLVVNQAQITDVRTLFCNDKNHYDQYYTEGVYMAPNALMADGLTQAFANPGTDSWPTLGAQLSKYVPTGSQTAVPYPHARLGFILHSPVLLLNEGTRTITITLACQYNADICPKDPFLTEELGMSDLLSDLQTALTESFFYFTQDSLAAALGQGLDSTLGNLIQTNYLTKSIPGCYGPNDVNLYQATVNASTLETALGLTSAQITTLTTFFPPRTVFEIQFSGAKGWVAPLSAPTVTISPISPGSTEFGLVITATLDPTLPAVTFYDAKVYGVDYQTTDPLVMVTLDDTIRIRYKSSLTKPDCCLETVANTDHLWVSTYQFFKYVQVNAFTSDKSYSTTIVTDVCGLKNFIVQNDQNVMDVNSPVYPFGTRPTIIDFDPVQPNPFPPTKPPNLTGPNFYIGSAEIFCKAWTSVWIGINWQNKPADFREYYAGYLLKTVVIGGVTHYHYGLHEHDFEVNVAALLDGTWTKEKSSALAVAPFATHNLPTPTGGTDHNRLLFDANEPDPSACLGIGEYDYSFYIEPENFPITTAFTGFPASLTKYNTDTRNGFIRFTLEKQDFLHKDYSYVLARQMIAFGKLPDTTVDGAVYYDGNFYVVDTTDLYNEYLGLQGVAGNIQTEVGSIAGVTPLIGPIGVAKANTIRTDLGGAATFPPSPPALVNNANVLNATVAAGVAALAPHAKPAAVIPKEPWTPVIQNMVIHYSATATITDIGFIQLYPYDGTYEIMNLSAQPSLLPTFCGEGFLFLGVQALLPGEQLNILFQFAEATADSEDAADKVCWDYLTNNQWQPLSPDFQVIADSTENLTRTGIVELAIPDNITTANTVMPAGLSWLRAWVPTDVPGVCETIAIYTQAVEASFVPTPANPATGAPGNDLSRLATPLAAGSLSKLNTAVAAVTQVQQPMPSFGGQAQEQSGNAFFTRISELLRHKGRGIQKWDYERLVLQQYPQVWRAKCINHSYFLNAHEYMYDFPMAPGNVMVAVIPDTTQLAPADSLQPRVPVSILEDIKTMLSGIISPFIQLFVVNPRYEPIDFCLQPVLVQGMSQEFFSQQVQVDLTQFLAPWTTGDMDAFEFGQPLYRSDVLRFLESLYYIDYLLDLQMTHQGDPFPNPADPPDSMEPLTPRSILVAGNITVKIPSPLPGPCSPPLPGCANLPLPVVDHCRKPKPIQIP